MAFNTEPLPEAGVATQVAPRVSRIVANNPSLMTYHGTNTYLIDAENGIYVLDPGPASDQKHLQYLTQFVGDKAAGIIVSHHHSDHFGLTPQLRDALQVPVYAYEVFADDTFRPDVRLRDGDMVAGMVALHTPGHASDHLCFAMDNGVLFSGDHVMSWNSSIVALPDGDMAAYCAQLERLLLRPDTLYLPGHGPPLSDPLPFTKRLLDHRVRRESAIVAALRESPATAEALAHTLYRKTDPHVAWAALRNVEAHLMKLKSEGLVMLNAENEWLVI